VKREVSHASVPLWVQGGENSTMGETPAQTGGRLTKVYCVTPQGGESENAYVAPKKWSESPFLQEGYREKNKTEDGACTGAKEVQTKEKKGKLKNREKDFSTKNKPGKENRKGGGDHRQEKRI